MEPNYAERLGERTEKQILKKIYSWYKQYTNLQTLVNENSSVQQIFYSLMTADTATGVSTHEFKHLARSKPGDPAMTRKKNFKKRKLGIVKHIQLYLCTREDFSEEEDALSGGLLTAWCRGHVHQLAHGIGNYAETHGWPEARYSA